MIIGGTVARCLSEPMSITGYILFPLIVRSFGLIGSAVGICMVYMREGPAHKEQGSINQYEAIGEGGAAAEQEGEGLLL